MKTKILIFCAFLISIHAFSQSNSFILAGDTVGDSGCPVIYHDIPDTIIDDYLNTDNYYFDLNEDSINDFYFLSFYEVFFSGGYQFYSRIYPLTSNCYILCKESTFLVDTLNFNDTICDLNYWKNNYCLLSSVHGSIESGTSFSDGLWKNITNKYIGLKIFLNNHEIYGWCKISVQSSHRITIHELAYKNCYAGNESVDLNFLEVSPNPANTYLNIIFKGNAFPADINLFNTQGNLILSEKLTGTESNLDVSDIPQGIYILKFVSKKGVSTEKVIIQH